MIAPRYAFHFDSRACSGCKACQVACKDKHGLEVGRNWRRVYEVSGGGWQRRGEAWVSDVFAFHLSISCNHCEAPICAEVCPALALQQREDGIVLLDAEKCIGCRYCEWACPYGSPQYDAARGVMSKCTFCADELDAGRPPVCVSACPLRVLEFGEQYENGAAEQAATQAPLPDRRLTDPALVLSEHRDAKRALEAGIEVIPRQRHELHEWSLVAFTLLCHLAAGSVMVLGGLRLLAAGTAIDLPPRLDAAVWILASATTLLALALSLRHLGSPGRAYRAVLNVRSSWLSREILATITFGALCVAASVLNVRTESTSFALILTLWLGSLCALTLVLVISMVYRLRTVPAWNSARTPLSFLCTSWLMGTLAVAISHGALSGDPGLQRRLAGGAIAFVALRRAVSAVVDLSNSAPHRRAWLPGALLASSGVVLLGILVAPLFTSQDRTRDMLLLLLAGALVLTAEIVERHRFFKSYVRSGV